MSKLSLHPQVAQQELQAVAQSKVLLNHHLLKLQPQEERKHLGLQDHHQNLIIEEDTRTTDGEEWGQ